MAGVWYVTRDEVSAALDVKKSARANAKIDRVIESCSRQAEAILHRRFYPEIATRYFAWPDLSGSTTFDLWLDDSELISVTSIIATTGTIPASGYYLEPNRFGPPFNRISIARTTSYAFGGGLSQRDIAVAGTFGYKLDENAGPVLTSAALAGDATITTGPGLIGVGALIRLDSERLIVTGASQVTTGQTLTALLDIKASAVTVSVADGTQFAIGETLLIESEYVRVVDIAGNALTVQRAQDGSVLAAHQIGAVIYAPRRLSVARAQLGTTAAGHTLGSTVQIFAFPGPVKVFTMALVLDTLEQESSAYARTTGAGNAFKDNGGRGLEVARKNAITSCGRFNRTAAV